MPGRDSRPKRTGFGRFDDDNERPRSSRDNRRERRDYDDRERDRGNRRDRDRRDERDDRDRDRRRDDKNYRGRDDRRQDSRDKVREPGDYRGDRYNRRSPDRREKDYDERRKHDTHDAYARSYTPPKGKKESPSRLPPRDETKGQLQNPTEPTQTLPHIVDESAHWDAVPSVPQPRTPRENDRWTDGQMPPPDHDTRDSYSHQQQPDGYYAQQQQAPPPPQPQPQPQTQPSEWRDRRAAPAPAPAPGAPQQDYYEEQTTQTGGGWDYGPTGDFGRYAEPQVNTFHDDNPRAGYDIPVQSSPSRQQTTTTSSAIPQLESIPDQRAKMYEREEKSMAFDGGSELKYRAGDLVVRQKRLFRITKVERSTDPPSYRIQNGDGKEVNTEASQLTPFYGDQGGSDVLSIRPWLKNERDVIPQTSQREMSREMEEKQPEVIPAPYHPPDLPPPPTVQSQSQAPRERERERERDRPPPVSPSPRHANAMEEENPPAYKIHIGDVPPPIEIPDMVPIPFKVLGDLEELNLAAKESLEGVREAKMALYQQYMYATEQIEKCRIARLQELMQYHNNTQVELARAKDEQVKILDEQKRQVMQDQSKINSMMQRIHKLTSYGADENRRQHTSSEAMELREAMLRHEPTWNQTLKPNLQVVIGDLAHPIFDAKVVGKLPESPLLAEFKIDMTDHMYDVYWDVSDESVLQIEAEIVVGDHTDVQLVAGHLRMARFLIPDKFLHGRSPGELTVSLRCRNEIGWGALTTKKVTLRKV